MLRICPFVGMFSSSRLEQLWVHQYQWWLQLVMEDVEERALGSFNVQPLFWKSYVDDVCTAVPSHVVQHLLQHLNSIEQSIHFTVELVSEGLLPFLDVHLVIIQMVLSFTERALIQTSTFTTHRTILSCVRLQ